jgi:hypothetical protein
MQIEADHRGRGVRFHVEPVGFHREHGEQIAVRMIARGRAGAAIAGRAEIGAGLQRARRQRAARAARALRELAHIRRNVHHQPVPEARAGRRVRVVAGDGEALRARRRIGPLEMRRHVAAGAAEAEIGRQDEILRQIVAVLETVAGDRERHVVSPSQRTSGSSVSLLDLRRDITATRALDA